MKLSKTSDTLEQFFAKGSGEKRLKQKAKILDYEDRPKLAYWVAEGFVKVVSRGTNGEERINYIYGPGDLFPIRWIFRKDQLSVAFYAFTDVVLRTQPIKKLEAYFIEEPNSMERIVNEQINVIETIYIANIASAEARIAHRLRMLALNFGSKRGDQMAIDLPINIQEFAELVGLSRETTGKVLAKFEREGMVILGRHQILACPDKLQMVLQP